MSKKFTYKNYDYSFLRKNKIYYNVWSKLLGSNVISTVTTSIIPSTITITRQMDEPTGKLFYFDFIKT